MKTLLYFTILVICSNLNAQNTWTKYIPGSLTFKSIIYKDTIFTFGTGRNYQGSMAFILNKYIQNGDYISSDTLNSKVVFNNSTIQTAFDGYGRVNPIIQNDSLIIPIYVQYDSIVQIELFKYPNWESLNINLNQGKNSTIFVANNNFDKRNYGIIRELQPVTNKYGFNYHKVVQFTDSNYRIIKEQKKGSLSFSEHIPRYENIFSDNQNKANLFLQLLDCWDFKGEPDKFEGVIQKIDTNGNLIWECRTAGDQDSINTSFFQMAQIPNGNILCSWEDLNYRPFKNSKDPLNYLPTGNLTPTIWFAEIDYQTGKKMWTKNNRQFLDWKMGTSDTDFTLVTTYDAIKLDNSIVWCGLRFVNRDYPQSYTRVPFLFKTDFHGNPVWYREYDLWLEDNTDRGFTPYSIIKTSDNGFLLTGDYQSLVGSQISMLLKLDSNGCFEPGCNAFDKVVKIKLPEKLCKINPNPARDFINIEYPKNGGKWELKIFDLTGKEIFHSHEQLQTIPANNFPTGPYFIQLTNKSRNNTETHKVFIEPK
jgi:hypothetical protein